MILAMLYRVRRAADNWASADDNLACSSLNLDVRDDDGLPNARPIAFSDSPRCPRSHNSIFSAVANLGSGMHPCRNNSGQFDACCLGEFMLPVGKWKKYRGILLTSHGHHSERAARRHGPRSFASRTGTNIEPNQKSHQDSKLTFDLGHSMKADHRANQGLVVDERE